MRLCNRSRRFVASLLPILGASLLLTGCPEDSGGPQSEELVVSALTFSRADTVPTESGLSVSIELRNDGRKSVDVADATVRFTSPGGMDLSGSISLGGSGATTVPARESVTVTRPVLVATSAPSGAVSASVELLDESGTPVPLAGTASGGFVVLEPARLLIDAVTGAPACAGGPPGAVRITVTNAGQSAAMIGAVTVSLYAGEVDETGSFTQQPDSANPLIVAAGATADLDLSVSYDAGTPLGAVTLDADVEAVDARAGLAAGALLVDASTLTVEVAPSLFFTTVTAPAAVSRGQSQVPVTVQVSNAGSVAVLVSSSTLHFLAGAAAVDEQYDVTKAAAYPVTPSIPAGGTLSLPFLVNVDVAATIGTITVDVAAIGIDSVCASDPTAPTAAANTGNWNVQTPASLTGMLLAPAAATVGQSFTVSLQAANGGGAAASAVTPSDPVASCGACASKVSGPDVASATIAGGTTTTFTWTYRAEASSAGATLSFGSQATGADANSASTVATGAVTSGGVVFATAAALSASLVPSRTTASLGQTFTVSLEVTNSGEEAALVVAPSDPTASCGTCVAKLSGPDVASTSVAGGTSQTFVWDYRADLSTAGAAATMSASASGTAAITGSPVSTGNTASGGIVLQTPAALSATLTPPVTEVRVGENFTLTLLVSNGGEAAAESVDAADPIASCPGCASKVLGPNLASATLTSGSSAAFQWTYRADASTAGTTTTFTSSAAGSDANSGSGAETGAVVSVGVGFHNPATVFAYDPSGRLIGEYGEDGVVVEELVYLDGRVIASLRPSGAYAVQTDQVGAPRAVLAEGTAVWAWEPEPYGATPPDEDPDGDGTAFVFEERFPGQRHEASTGLFRNFHRNYDPELGRYVEADPIGLAGGLNLYAYAEGAPLTNVDPFGLAPSSYPGLLPAGGVFSARGTPPELGRAMNEFLAGLELKGERLPYRGPAAGTVNNLAGALVNIVPFGLDVLGTKVRLPANWSLQPWVQFGGCGEQASKAVEWLRKDKRFEGWTFEARNNGLASDEFGYHWVVKATSGGNGGQSFVFDPNNNVVGPWNSKYSAFSHTK